METRQTKGEAVNVKFTVPVAFRLSGPELPKAEEVKQSDMDEVVVVGYAAKDDPTPEGGSVKGENEDEVFTMVEVMPKFPGGQAGLFQYLARSIKYPVIAQKVRSKAESSYRWLLVKTEVCRISKSYAVYLRHWMQKPYA